MHRTVTHHQDYPDRTRSTAHGFGSDSNDTVRLEYHSPALTRSTTRRVTRKKTLVKPERRKTTRKDHRPLVRGATNARPIARAGATTIRRTTTPHIPPTSALLTYTPAPPPNNNDSDEWWNWVVCCCTFWVTPRVSGWLRVEDGAVGRAWKEKVTLCLIILTLCILTMIFTFGLKPMLCPSTDLSSRPLQSYIPNANEVTFRGHVYHFDDVARAAEAASVDKATIEGFAGKDMTSAVEVGSECANVLPQSIRRAPLGEASWLASVKPHQRLYYSWSDLSHGDNRKLVAFNGRVMELQMMIDSALEMNATLSGSSLEVLQRSVGRDATYALLRTAELRHVADCLAGRYTIASIGAERTSCVVHQGIVIVLGVVVGSVVGIRVLMALVFYWWIEKRESEPPILESLQIDTIKKANPYRSLPVVPARGHQVAPYAPIPAILLITVYSESHAGIHKTLSSLAETHQPESHKLLFVVCDGLIKGEDWGSEGLQTHEVVRGMGEWAFGPGINGEPGEMDGGAKDYLGVGGRNRAWVYAGYFRSNNKLVPMVLIIKCGLPNEIGAAKPGNRGKRDSQLILMNLLSKSLFGDRMTEMEWDIARKVQSITGRPMDKWEVVGMVDADTEVAPTSLPYILHHMHTHPLTLGVCGETRITNRKDSWVTLIQVFEYYISHHLGKAFESVFGGVTCLPGCFSFYRVFSHSYDGRITPLLASPAVLDEYAESNTLTLHTKNLLLLGEDRFLTTLLLREFPNRHFKFVAKAVCYTTVPDQFKILLSQRRRWINSTVHNLAELVRRRNGCGVFCLSMRFVVVLDLLSTAILPASLFALYILIIMQFTPSGSPSMLALMILSLLFPAILIALTTRRWAFVGYMFIYLLALPVWNLVLPVYAFWHFDDFGWGQTRKVEGDDGAGHGDTKGDKDNEGELKVDGVVLKRYEDWEYEYQMHSQNLIHQQWDTHVPMDHPLSRPHSGEPWPGSPVSPSHPSGHSGGTPTSSRMQAVSRQKTRATQYRKALPQPPAVGVAPAVDYPGYDDVYAAYATPGDYEGGQGAYDMTTPYGTAYEIQNHPPEHEAAAQQQVSGWNFSGSSYRPPTAYDLSIPQVNAATYRTSGGTYPANESYIPSYSTIPRDWSGASYDIVETPTWNSQRTSGVPVIPKRRGSLRSLPSVHLPGWIADGESGASRNTAEDAWRSTAHMATQEIEMADVGIPSLKTDVPRVEITSATPISERASFTLPSPRPGGDTPDAERAKDNHQPALVKQADQMNTDKDNSGPGVRAPSTLVTAEKKKRRKKKDESLILVKKFWDANNMFEKGSEDKENEKKSSARNPTSKGAKGGDAHGAASNDAAKEKPPRAPDANQSSGARAGYGSLNSSVPKIRTEDLRGSWRGYGELRKSYPVLDMRWSSGHSESSSNGAADSAKAPQTLRDSKETESPGGSEKGTLPRSAPAPIFPNHMAQNIVSSTLGFSFDHAKIGELPPIHLDGESMSSIAMEAPNESNFIYSSTMAAKSKRFSGVSMASSFSFDLESNVNGDEDNMRERLRREEFFGPGVGSIRWNKR